MLLTRLYLRNFRVYEDELDLEIPPGLVGIYGPNGAGKSSLLEAILFTLWGRARTAKEEIRSSGVAADCVTEVEFEHEGHLYVVRRIVSGINSTVRAEGHCDGLIMSEGVRDTGRYLHSVLGMDDAAFRASVFAEQKQLAAFSSQTPAERRRLVLQLLGITPLDGARDAARKDARSVTDQHQQLRRLLPDLAALTVAAADAEARAAASETSATDEAAAADSAQAQLDQATATLARLDGIRQAWEALVIEGKGARADLDAATSQVVLLTAESHALDEAARELDLLRPVAEGVAALEAQLRLLTGWADALATLEAIIVPPEPDPPDTAGHAALVAEVGDLRSVLASVNGQRQAVQAELDRARAQADRSADLAGAGDCPLCGQNLGDAYIQVQQHRAAEVNSAEDRLAGLVTECAGAESAFAEAQQRLDRSSVSQTRATQARAVWAQACDRRDQARQLVARAEAAASEATAGGGTAPDAHAPASAAAVAERAGRVGQEVARRLAAATAVAQLQGRLQRRPALDAALAGAERQAETAELRRSTLLRQVEGLGHDVEALQAAQHARETASVLAAQSGRAAQNALLAATRDRAAAEAEARTLTAAREQHDQLASLETEARHLARVADLLSEFRNTVVASVGPRLAVQAAELFGELTDHEYDELQVDPETYEIQISDAGRTYGLDRFSGSEVDLANLALRVAISEHVRFQSGGSVGLLVLDEVFGPLDEDRKARMLLALERLKGRFRQVLVVTHDANIKEQLPNAIEVVKQPGRRATARVLNG